MKKIFEEYGGVIHVALAIVALVAVVALLVGGTNGGVIGGAFKDITDKFMDKTSGAMDAVSVNGSGSGSGEAGLYETGSNYTVMLTSWDELVADGTVHVEDGVVYTNVDLATMTNSSSDALAGDLLLPADGSVTALGDFDMSDYSGRVAFAGCLQLTGIVIPNNVTNIGDAAFAGCSNLTNVSISENITIISDGMFGDCISLANITIPDKVTSINDAAFAGCQFTSIKIPKSVENIGEVAFARCTNLRTIEFLGTVTEWNNVSLYYDTSFPEDNWNAGVPAMKVVCRDGEVSL